MLEFDANVALKAMAEEILSREPEAGPIRNRRDAKELFRRVRKDMAEWEKEKQQTVEERKKKRWGNK